MSYTKGPWTFRPNPCECNDCSASHWIDGPPDAPGATIGKPIAEVREYYKGESEANARLIAAAPDLADALENLRLCADRVNSLQHAGNRIDPSDWSDLYAAQNAAREVLRKARGGA